MYFSFFSFLFLVKQKKNISISLRGPVSRALNFRLSVGHRRNKKTKKAKEKTIKAEEIREKGGWMKHFLHTDSLFIFKFYRLSFSGGISF
jgi:hypothetical protein